jgi:hypothetical protein
MATVAQRPVYGRVPPDQSNRAKPYEDTFHRYLDASGWNYDVEPDKLLHQPYVPNRPLRGMAPDIRLTNTVDGLTVYLELTEADRFVTPEQLPSQIRRKNRRHSRSHKPYISPAAYLELKRQKIRLTMDLHPGVVIVLIDYATQQAIYALPGLLQAMIDQEITQRLLLPAA